MANALIPNQNILNRRGYSDEGIDLSLYQDRTGYGLAQLDPYGRVQIGGDPGLQEYLNYLAAPQTREVMGNVLADTIPVSAQGQAIERLKQQYSALQNAQSPIQAAVRAADMGLEGGALVADVLPYGKAAVTGLGALGALMSRKGVPEGIARAPQAARMTGTIGSTGAKTADLDALARAQELKASGASADDIYAQTRWWLDHPDGRPRFEIDDSGMKVMNWPDDLKGGDSVPIGSIGENISHPELYAAYPDAADIKFTAMGGRMSGEFVDPPNHYSNPVWQKFDPRIKATPDSILHELQHGGPQRLDNLAKGSNPLSFADESGLVDSEGVAEILKDAIARKNSGEWVYESSTLSEIVDTADASNDAKDWAKNIIKAGDVDTFLKNTPYAQYHRTAGEAEARLVQNRMNMTMDERLANPFYKNFDVPLEDQIVRMDSGIAQSADSLPMDEASRMARAEEMGMDTDTYHYSQKNSDTMEFETRTTSAGVFDDLGVHSGSSKAARERANKTIGIDRGTGKRKPMEGETYPLKIKKGRQLLGANGKPMKEEELSDYLRDLTVEIGEDPFSNKGTEALQRHIWGQYDSIPYINSVEDAGNISYISPPKNIRSKFAKFDPAKKNSANLLAGGAAAAFGLNYLAEPERKEYVTR